MLPKDLSLLPHEIAHYKTLESLAGECTLFLKRENNAFPISKPCKVALFGNGARHTLKGGTGSGDVNSHFFNNAEYEFELNGFEITTKKWLDAYDEIKKNKHISFVKRIKQEAKKAGIGAPAYAVGQVEREVEYNLSISEYEGDICVYILSRASGESSDRRLEKGDVYLTDTEIKDILFLNKKFDKFLLTLNVSGVVDLSPILEVKNIFLLSQLGVVTSSILVNVILGKINPSGKLSDSWARPDDYPFIYEFGDKNNTRYLEGIYVGYRYFNSKGLEPLFPFGFGKSYSQFDYDIISYKLVGDEIKVKVNVTNNSEIAGKEVIQLYLSSEGKINTARNTLVAFNKTINIKPHHSTEMELKFKLSSFPVYDEENHEFLVQKGIYIVRVGNSSVELKDVFKIDVDKDIVVKKVESIFDSPDFKDYEIGYPQGLDFIKVETLELDASSILTKNINYSGKLDVKIPEFVKKLNIDDLIRLNLGDYKTGLAGVIGQTGSLVPGAAGETTLRIPEITNSLVMADGPAGLRLISEYKLNSKGHYSLIEDSIIRDIKEFIPPIAKRLFNVKKNHKKKGNVVYQYCSALPIATALAQSFNDELSYEIGRLVGEEMKLYDVDIWLAPAMNIHRNILCGRNFEYYSEDPYLTSVIVTGVVKGVQSEGKMACIKHFACNNQETNRFNSNSIISERAIREIYLSAFERVITEAKPACVMASYNLINGVHASESSGLLIKSLRNEWNYKGLVMTDWVITGQTNDKSSVHPASRASTCLSNGINICMPGSKKDIKDIKKALKAGKITRAQLEYNASIVYSYITGEKII